MLFILLIKGDTACPVYWTSDIDRENKYQIQINSLIMQIKYSNPSSSFDTISTLPNLFDFLSIYHGVSYSGP